MLPVNDFPVKHFPTRGLMKRAAVCSAADEVWWVAAESQCDSCQGPSFLQQYQHKSQLMLPLECASSPQRLFKPQPKHCLHWILLQFYVFPFISITNVVTSDILQDNIQLKSRCNRSVGCSSGFCLGASPGRVFTLPQAHWWRHGPESWAGAFCSQVHERNPLLLHEAGW